jgi:hypothetical protein
VDALLHTPRAKLPNFWKVSCWFQCTHCDEGSREIILNGAGNLLVLQCFGCAQAALLLTDTLTTHDVCCKGTIPVDDNNSCSLLHQHHHAPRQALPTCDRSAHLRHPFCVIIQTGYMHVKRTILSVCVAAQQHKQATTGPQQQQLNRARSAPQHNTASTGGHLATQLVAPQCRQNATHSEHSNGRAMDSLPCSAGAISSLQDKHLQTSTDRHNCACICTH